MKKVTYLLAICATFLLMIRCTDNEFAPDKNQVIAQEETISESWDFKSLLILESMNTKVIEDKIKSLSKEELGSFEKDLILAYNKYRKQPSEETLKEYITLLGFTDTKDYLFKRNAMDKLRGKLFDKYYNGSFSAKNLSDFSTEISKLKSIDHKSSRSTNSTAADPLCITICSNTSLICQATAQNAYNNAPIPTCTLGQIPGCQPNYIWVIMGTSNDREIVNGCVGIGGHFARDVCGFGSTPSVTYNDVFKFDYDPSRWPRVIVYNRSAIEPTNCNDYNTYNACLALKETAEDNRDITYALALAKCSNDFASCLSKCN